MADQKKDPDIKLRTLERYRRVSKRDNGVPIYDPMGEMRITPKDMMKKQDDGLIIEEEIVSGVYILKDEKGDYLGRFYYPNENGNIATIQEINDDNARHILRNMEVRIRALEDMFFPTKYVQRSKRVEERLNHSKLGEVLKEIGDISVFEMAWPKLLQLALSIVNPYENENRDSEIC